MMTKLEVDIFLFLNYSLVIDISYDRFVNWQLLTRTIHYFCFKFYQFTNLFAMSFCLHF